MNVWQRLMPQVGALCAAIAIAAAAPAIAEPAPDAPAAATVPAPAATPPPAATAPTATPETAASPAAQPAGTPAKEAEKPAAPTPAAAATPAAAPPPAQNATAPPAKDTAAPPVQGSAAPPVQAVETPAAPSPAAATTPAPAAQVEPPKPNPVGMLLRPRLDALLSKMDEADKPDATALKAFYEAQKDEPLWIADDVLNGKAKAAISEIKQANDWGLDAKAFDVPEASGPLSKEQAADAEIELSLAALKYARHARGGRIMEPATQLSSYLDRTPQLLEPKVVLEKLVAASDGAATLRSFHPQHPQFEKLRQASLAMLKSASAAATVVKLPAKGPALVPGQKHADVVLLRERLKVPVAVGTPEHPQDASFYDEALATAVKAFQSEKGLRPDGVVGAMSRAAFNEIDVPSPAKLRANMEEWRWMPDLGDYYVWVNLPEFMVRVVKGGQIIHEERVIAGLVDKQTPVFSAAMELVTLNPSWNVPESIKVRELYPSLARGGSYFTKQGLTLKRNGKPIDPYSVDWGSTDIRQFDIQQPPGGSNVLGVVKLSFPNKHIVYMHDTPTKDLFNEASRPFSHGCMRVRNPMRLAELVLEADKGWDAATIASMRGDGRVETPITLDKKVPVHITYFTSWIADDGTEKRFKDIYGHEKRIMQALDGRFDEIARGQDHLAPVTYPKVEVATNPFENFMSSFFGGF